MLASLLLTLTASALAVLAVAAVGLLAAGRPAHAAPTPGANHRRLGVGAALVGVAGAGCAFTLAGPLVAATTGAALAGSVLSCRRRCEVWRVRGVLVWALLASATTGAVAWLALRVASADSPGQRAVAAVAWLVLVISLVRSRGYFRGLVARRSRRDQEQEPATRLPVVWLGTAAAASAMVLAGGAGFTATEEHAPSQAADEDSPTGDRHGGVGTSGGSGPSPSGPATSPTPDPPSPATGPTAEPGGSTGGAADGSSGGAGSATSTAGPTSGPAPASTPTKTPGYAKDKPHRPSDAPSPGSGRPGGS